MEYAYLVNSISQAYNVIGQKDKGYQYTINAVSVIDKRFDAFVKELQMLGKEKAFNRLDESHNITNFYQYLFDVTNKYDTTYATEKEAQVTQALMKVAQ